MSLDFVIWLTQERRTKYKVTQSLSKLLKQKQNEDFVNKKRIGLKIATPSPTSSRFRLLERERVFVAEPSSIVTLFSATSATATSEEAALLTNSAGVASTASETATGAAAGSETAGWTASTSGSASGISEFPTWWVTWLAELTQLTPVYFCC